jgi:hypothetical protein
MTSAELDERVLAAVRAAPGTAARGIALQVEASERQVSSSLGRLRLAGLVKARHDVCPLCAGRARLTLWAPSATDTPAEPSRAPRSLVQRPRRDASGSEGGPNEGGPYRNTPTGYPRPDE